MPHDGEEGPKSFTRRHAGRHSTTTCSSERDGGRVVDHDVGGHLHDVSAPVGGEGQGDGGAAALGRCVEAVLRVVLTIGQAKRSHVIAPVGGRAHGESHGSDVRADSQHAGDTVGDGGVSLGHEPRLALVTSALAVRVRLVNVVELVERDVSSRRRSVAATGELGLQTCLDRRGGVSRCVDVSGLLADHVDGPSVGFDRSLAANDHRVVSCALGEEVVVQRHRAVALLDGCRTLDADSSDYVARVLVPVEVFVLVVVGPLRELDDSRLLVAAVAVVVDAVSVVVLTPTNRDVGIGGFAGSTSLDLGDLEQHVLPVYRTAHASNVAVQVEPGVGESLVVAKLETGCLHLHAPIAELLDLPLRHGSPLELLERGPLQLEGGRLEPLDLALGRVGGDDRAPLGVLVHPVGRRLVDGSQNDLTLVVHRGPHHALGHVVER